MINRFTFALALVGMVLTLHLWIQKQRGFDQGCLGIFAPKKQSTSISECSEVVAGEAGSLLGADNIVLGFLFYVTIGALCLTEAFASRNRRRLLGRITFSVAAIGFMVTLYLMYMLLFELKTLCILCLNSAVLVTTLVALQSWRMKHPAPSRDKDPVDVLREFGLFAVFSFLAGALLVADLFFINQIGTASLLREPRAQEIREVANAVLEERIEESFLRAMAPCSFSDEAESVVDMQALISPGDPFLGSPNASVTLVELFDPNCPSCKKLHPVLQRVVAKYHDQVRFYFKPFPLWTHSVKQIEAIWLAAEGGKYFEMIDHQFRARRRGGLSEDALEVLADSLHLDLKAFEQGLRSGRYRQKALQYKRLVNNLGIHSAPKILLNGRIVGKKGQTITDGCVGKLIEQEIGTAHQPTE